MDLADIITPQMVIPELSSQDKVSVLAELVQPLVECNQKLDKDHLVKILLEREKLGSTGIGEGIAIPHGKVENLDQMMISCGRSSHGVNFDSMDGQPAHLFFLLVAPESSTGAHLKTLAMLARMLKNPTFREGLLAAEGVGEIHQLIMNQQETD